MTRSPSCGAHRDLEKRLPPFLVFSDWLFPVARKIASLWILVRKQQRAVEIWVLSPGLRPTSYESWRGLVFRLSLSSSAIKNETGLDQCCPAELSVKTEMFRSSTISRCCCLVTKLYPILCDPMDCSLPGSSVYGISQARILEWVAIAFTYLNLDIDILVP